MIEATTTRGGGGAGGTAASKGEKTHAVVRMECPSSKVVSLPPVRIHSRAVLLVQREVSRLRKNRPWGIEVLEADDDDPRPLHVSAVIHGPKESAWEGGILNVSVQYPEDYDDRSPTIFMTTVPFHPNIDMYSGQVCQDFLEDSVKGECTGKLSLESVLVSIQFLLVNPSLDYPINDTAAAYLRDTPRTYYQMVRDCVLASRRLDAGQSAFEMPQPPGESQSAQLPTQQATLPRSVKRTAPVSFEDYHDSWQQLATSLPAAAPELRYSQSQMKGMLRKHMSLFYGKFKFNDPNAMRFRDKDRFRSERITNMQQVYASEKHKQKVEMQDDEDPEEEEVDDMLAWCANID